MIPSSLKFHWMAPEPTASALAKKIISINKHAWDLLARLNEDQVFDLIIMIEERIDFFPRWSISSLNTARIHLWIFSKESTIR